MMENLISELGENAKHYLILALIFSLALIAFGYFRYVSSIQILIVLLTAASYVSWGVIHHYAKGDLHPRVVFEYLSLAVFGVLILWFLLLRA